MKFDPVWDDKQEVGLSGFIFKRHSHSLVKKKDFFYFVVFLFIFIFSIQFVQPIVPWVRVCLCLCSRCI